MKEKPFENWTVDPQLREVELIYRSSAKHSEKPTLCSPEQVEAYLRALWNPDHLELREEFVIILLNNALNVLGWCRISIGGKNATVVDITSIVQLALLSNASSVIAAHNHPSGVLKPSSADINLTNRMQRGLEAIGVSLKDHMILTCDSHYSFMEHNLLSKAG